MSQYGSVNTFHHHLLLEHLLKVPDVAIGKEYKVDDIIPAGVIDTFAPAFPDNLPLKLVIDTSSKITAAV